MRPIVTQRGLSVCHSSEPCKNGWTDRDAVWVEDSGGQENHVLEGGPDHEWGEEIFFLGGRGNPSYSIGPLSCELWKNGWTDRYALWVEDLDGPKESHIIWGPDPPTGRGNFGKRHAPNAWRHSDVNCAKTAEMIKMPFELLTRVDPRKQACVRGCLDPDAKGQFLGERTCPGMPDDNLLWSVQKQVNRSRCCLGYKLR